jgi:hypothetical protein
MIGTTVSHYKIVEKLGEGGMGVVYKAHDLELDRFVALKFLPAHLMGEEEQRKRFMQEAKAVSSLDHPNVCTIYEINRTPAGEMFIAMAYYEGTTLKAVVQKGALPLEKVLRYSVQIARGLSRAHEANVTHRDVKPANVIITRHDDAKIVDFGLAKLMHSTGLTRTGATMGTIAYMSPEQARGARVDHRTDIWSLGVVMYEMITGDRPFKGDFEQAVIYSILNEEELRLSGLVPELPQPVARVVHRALAKDPAKRFASMSDVLAELEPMKVQVSGESPVQGTATRPPSPRRKRPWMGAVIGGVLVLAAAAIYALVLRPSGDGAREAAIAAREFSHRAEQAALSEGARDHAAGEVWAAEALVSRASAEFDAGRFAQATTLFESAAAKFTAALEAARSGRHSGEKDEAGVPEAETAGTSKAVSKPAAEDPSKSTGQAAVSKEEAREPSAPATKPAVTKVADRSGDAERERETMRQSKADLDRAAGGEALTELVDIGPAAQTEKEADQLMARADYERATERFGEANRLYRTAAETARGALVEARRKGDALRDNLQAMRSAMPRDMVSAPDYKDGLAAEQQGDRSREAGRYVTALRQYESASQRYRAAQAARDQQVAEITSLIGRYRLALEAEDLRALESLHTDFTAQMRKDWSDFFSQVSGLRAQLDVDSVALATPGAVAQVTVHFSYTGARSEKAHQWDMIMNQRDGRWFIAEVERKP